MTPDMQTAAAAPPRRAVETLGRSEEHPAQRVEREHEERSRPAWVSLVGLKRLSAVYLWIAFMVLFGILADDTFLTSTTYKLVFSEGVVTCVLALAFLVPLPPGSTTWRSARSCPSRSRSPSTCRCTPACPPSPAL